MKSQLYCPLVCCLPCSRRVRGLHEDRSVHSIDLPRPFPGIEVHDNCWVEEYSVGFSNRPTSSTAIEMRPQRFLSVADSDTCTRRVRRLCTTKPLQESYTHTVRYLPTHFSSPLLKAMRLFREGARGEQPMSQSAFPTSVVGRTAIPSFTRST